MKIVALAPFPFANAEFGGGERIDNLLTRVEHPIKVFCANLTGSGTEFHKNLEILHHMVPKEYAHLEYDMAVARASEELFAKTLIDYEPDLIILEHPWQARAISGQKFLYDAHNNETKMKQLISSEETVREAGQLEAIALDANHITYCSKDDELVTSSPTTWIPNGTEWPKAKNSVGKNSRVLLFAGSAHPPNIGAAITLASLAPALSQYEIVITGACSDYVKTNYPNVRLLGHVTKKTLDYLMMTSHAFVNLAAAGSGTSLKVIKSLSYGLPVVSSPIGARGYEAGCRIGKTAQEVIEILGRLKTPAEWEMASEAATELAKGYSWDVIGAKFNSVVQSFS